MNTAPKYGTKLRRFTEHKPHGKPYALDRDHPAVTEARTLFEARIAWPGYVSPLLKSGKHNRKIGGIVVKGYWQGMPIYTLTLEERRTCWDGCAHWRDCFAPGTRVLLADLRWVPIETLQLGQKIVAFDEAPHQKTKRRKTRVATVEAIGRAVRPTFRIVTSRGVVSAAGGHLFLVRKGREGYGWQKASDLKPDDEIQFLVAPWEQDLSYDAGRVRGFVEGEGYVTAASIGSVYPKARMGWGQLPGNLLEEINAIVRAKGFLISHADRVSGVNRSTLTLVDIVGGWREVIRFLGVFRPTRLIERADEIIDNHDVGQGNHEPARVLVVESLGEQEVVTIATSAKTLIAEGFLAHNCYGNKMNWSERIIAGRPLIHRLGAELRALAQKHPHGYVIRLHVLGDFWSLDYVRRWLAWSRRIPQLHIFGYTSWPPSEAIGALLRDASNRMWTRFAIRLSNQPVTERGASTIDAARFAGGAIVCPAQTDRTECCGTCGLCWSTRRNIAFLRH